MSDFAWTPPEGMAPAVARAWLAFFRKAASGKAGYTCSPELYVTLYKAQLGRCYVCQTAKGINPEDPKGRGTGRLGVDHNHGTGAVRGLLCVKGEWSCNRIIGRYRDNPEAFRRAYQYLQQPPAYLLALVQAQLPDMPVEDRLAVAQQMMGLDRESLEKARNRAKLTQGVTPSFVVADEAYHGMREGPDGLADKAHP